MMEDHTLLEALGGRPVVERVHKLFYDKIYVHPWLKHFFLHISQELIEEQQTDFMISNMGGGKIYSGGLPKNVHRHMNISDELFDVRAALLRESILECGVTDELADRWLRIDNAFRRALVKTSSNPVEKRYNTDTILDFPKPD
ncbi:MAG: group 1 truncated hemoglobin [Gemmatimonadetes bacterium]|jgi:hemoglobin|nr:group 1 truncated hemoglobin [Gemmatimonadota bacterium]MBT6144616.1 group 1 truncated hemoglobin [Gemmatimonadota bacterium]MBT7863696.1 group 1 truncated hemoglobin [Gemmatimonadota bacterium]